MTTTDLTIVCGEDWQIQVSYAPDGVTSVALASVAMDIRSAATADAAALVSATVTLSSDNKTATLTLSAAQTRALRTGPPVGYADIFATVSGRAMRIAPLDDTAPPLSVRIVPNVTGS